MNKVLALSLVSVFLLSILVGYLPVLTTQAAANGMQTYMLEIAPYTYVVVVTGVNMGNPNATGAIGYYLNESLNTTRVTVSILNLTTGQIYASFTGNISVSPSTQGQVDAYYSPAAHAILMVINFTATKPETYSMGKIIDYVYTALHIDLVNATYNYLVDIYGNKVYTNGYATEITANAIVDTSLAQWQYFYLIQNALLLTKYDNEVTATVAPNVFSPENPSGAPAPAASAVLFAPISIVKIYNQMMNNQPVGWGRSLINITVNNPLQSSSGWYLYQLNFTGPGLIKIYFYPAVQIYSADQLYYQKPTVGFFSFTGPGTGVKAFNYTIIVMTMSPTVNVEAYYNQGEVGYSHTITINDVNLNTGGNNVSINGYPTFLVAFTFSTSNPQGQYIAPVLNGQGQQVYITATINGQTVEIPLYAVYVNASAYALQFSNLYWINSQDQVVKLSSFNLTLTNQLPIEPFPVVTQLSTSAFEMVPASTYTQVSGYDYSGILFTTPPGAQAITGTYMITGNSTIGRQYSSVYVTGFGTFYFKMPTPPSTSNSVLYYFSIEEDLATPAYPVLNGSTFYGLGIQTFLWFFPGTPSYYQVDVDATNFNALYPSQGNVYYNEITIQGDLYPITAVYGQYVQTTNIPAYQIISPAAQHLTLPITPAYFYQALVDLGLWNNNTVVYVTGYYYYPTQAEWYQMYGISYFDAIVIPPSVAVSNVTPSSLTCYNAIWVDFRSPDDVLVTGYYNGMFGMTYVQNISTLIPANGPVVNNVMPVLLLPPSDLKSTTLQFPDGAGALLISTVGFFSYWQAGANVPTTFTSQTKATGILYGQYVNVTGPLQYLISNYPGVSNYTEQTQVPGVLNVSAVLPNGVTLNWTAAMAPSEMVIGNVNATQYYINSQGYEQYRLIQVNNFTAIVPDILPQYNPVTLVPTPNFNVTVYVRYQLYDAVQNGMTIEPGVYYGPQNAVVVITPPNLTVGAKVTLYFVSGDYAVQHLFTKNYWNRSVTIQVKNTTLTLIAPKVVPLYQLTIPLQLIEPYYAAPYPAQLQIGTDTVTLLANEYNFLGTIPAPGKVGVGKFVNITIRFANGTTEKIYLTGDNITKLFESGTLNENGSCTGAYNATLSIEGLMSILHLTSVSQLNGSCLTITYYDNITHEIATAKICFGGVSVVSPVAITPAYIFYILTAKYVNATFGYPVTLAQSVAVQPFVSLNDTFLAKAQTGVVADLNVINVTIIDHYGNKYVIYYNSASGSTNVVINGTVKYSYSGDLLPTIPETAPNTGIFNGTPITFVINMPGTIYKNGTVFNGTLAVKLGNNVATLGPATNFALPAFSFAGKLFGYNSTMYVTVEDPATGSTVTLKTYIAAYNITPIRIAPVTIPVPMPANASIKLQYVYNQPITLTPTNQYIVIHVTSIINYTYVFYIATLVQPGKNATTTPPVLVNFQTVVPVPVIGPGIVAQVPVQFSQIGALGSGYYTITMFAVPFAGGPVISLYPAKLVFTNVYVNTTVV